MAEQNSISHTQMKETLQRVYLFARLGKAWQRKRREIKKPDEALRLEKIKLQSQIRDALTDARNCVQDPRLLARHDIALQSAFHFSNKLKSLEPDCDCKDKERQETYKRQINDHDDKFPFSYNHTQGEYVVRLPTVSPATGSTSSPSGRDGSQPRSAGPVDETSEDSSETPVYSQPNAPSPPSSPGGAINQTASPELECDESAPQQAARATPGPNGDGTNVIVVDDGTIADSIPSTAAGGKAQQTKRKGAVNSLIYTIRVSKRRRLDGMMPTTPSGEDECDEVSSESQPDDQAEHAVPPQRTIQFDEVYQNGNGMYKHFIDTYEGRYYILLCDEHTLHFGKNPIRAAATHLNTSSHRLTRDFSVAIGTLGIEVLGCDPDRQMLNNDAFETAVKNGYAPLGNQAARNRPGPQRQRQPTAKGRSRDQRNRDEAILDPVPGGIYLACWQKSVDQVAVIVLPRGCFGDPSFSDVGLPAGSLAEDTLLMDNVPECYRFCQDTRQITGWQEGYENGGERVGNREYPVMYFDGVEHMRKKSVAWMPTKHLRAYDRDGMASNGELISNYAHLRQFEAQRTESRATAHQYQDSLATDEDDAFSDVMDLESPQPGTSLPALQATETSVDSPEIAISNGPIPGPSGPHSHPANAIPTQQDLKPSPQGHSLIPPGPSIAVSTFLPPFSNAEFRPSPEDTAGPATMRGDWGPSQSPTTQGMSSLGDHPVDSSATELRRAASAALTHNRGPYASIGSENAALELPSIPSTSVGFPHVKMVQQAIATPRTASTTPIDTPNIGEADTLLPQPAAQDTTHKQEDETTTCPLRNEPRVDATPGTASHWLQDRGTPDSPIDLELYGQQRTAPQKLFARRTIVGSSSIFRRSFENPGVATPRKPPPVARQYWTMPNGEQISVQHGSSAGTSVSAAPGQPAVPEAPMWPL